MRWYETCTRASAAVIEKSGKALRIASTNSVVTLVMRDIPSVISAIFQRLLLRRFALQQENNRDTFDNNWVMPWIGLLVRNDVNSWVEWEEVTAISILGKWMQHVLGMSLEPRHGRGICSESYFRFVLCLSSHIPKREPISPSTVSLRVFSP